MTITSENCQACGEVFGGWTFDGHSEDEACRLLRPIDSLVHAAQRVDDDSRRWLIVIIPFFCSFLTSSTSTSPPL